MMLWNLGVSFRGCLREVLGAEFFITYKLVIFGKELRTEQCTLHSDPLG